MRKSEGLCWGRKVPPERPMYWNGRSESNFMDARAWWETPGTSLAEPKSHCGWFRVRAYLLRPERW